MKPAAKIPIVTILLIVANIVAAFAVLWQEELIQRFGFDPAHPSLETAFSSLFLHHNVLHLLGNMLFLAAVGASVEIGTGAFRFVAVYFLSGLGGVALHWALASKSVDSQPLIGASGCVAGCAAYYTARYTRTRLPLAPKFNVTVLAVTITWVALQFAGAFLRLGEDVNGSVSFWAHLGGFAVGLGLCVVFRAPDAGQRQISEQLMSHVAGRSPAAAMIAAERHLEKYPADPSALSELAEAARTLDERDKERSALLALLDVLPESEQRWAVARPVECGGIGSIPAMRRLLLADRFTGADVPLARALLQSVVDAGDAEPNRPDAMLALASIERATDEPKCASLLRQLEDAYPLHPAVDLAKARGWLA